MYLAQPMNGIGFPKPWKKVKSIAKGAYKGGKKGITKGGRYVGKKIKKYSMRAFAIAMWPVRRAVSTLVGRRARKIAYDRAKAQGRKAGAPLPQPTPAETAQARSWTKAKLAAKGPPGRFVASLAGATEFGDFGVTPGEIIFPPALLVNLTWGIIKSAAASGEAPADPRTDEDKEAGSEAPPEEPSTDEAPPEDELPPEEEAPAEEEAPSEEEPVEGAAVGSASRVALWTGLGLGLATVGAGAYVALRR